MLPKGKQEKTEKKVDAKDISLAYFSGYHAGVKDVCLTLATTMLFLIVLYIAMEKLSWD